MKESKVNNRSRGHFALGLIAAFVGLLGGGLTSAAGQARQLSLADILIALRSKKAVIEEKNKILADAVKQRGITFSLTPEIEKELGSTGAYKELIDAIREKAVAGEPVAVQKPETVKAPDVPVATATPAPPDFAFYRTRAASNLLAGELDLAVADLSGAIGLKPGEAQPYIDRGLVYLKQGKLDNAAADLDKGLGIDPKNVAAMVARAQIFEQKGDSANALAFFDKASTIDPSNAAAKLGSTKIRDAAAAEEKRVAAAAKAAELAKAEPRIVPVGAMNGFATDLVMPMYSAIDRRMNIQGKVTVQITLDEKGKLTDAQATEGPKSLRIAAVEAVRRSTFKPVMLQGKPVSASGYIVYNFVPNQ
jgi:TonB family protein